MREAVSVLILGVLVLLSFETRAEVGTITIEREVQAVTRGWTSTFFTDDDIAECSFDWRKPPKAGERIRVKTTAQDYPGRISGVVLDRDSSLSSFRCEWLMPMDPFSIDRLSWATDGYISGLPDEQPSR